MENDMKKRVLEQLRIVRRILHCKHAQNEVCIECKAKIKGDVSGIWGDMSGIKGDVSGIEGNVSGIEGNVIELIEVLRGGELAETAGGSEAGKRREGVA